MFKKNDIHSDDSIRTVIQTLKDKIRSANSNAQLHGLGIDHRFDEIVRTQNFPHYPDAELKIELEMLEKKNQVMNKP